jgi:glycosyltransferase involved in cell wall biosynthesis
VHGSASAGRRPRVLIACPGLDHVGRGFETFARECFAELAAAGELDVALAKGSGPRADRELVARAPSRNARPARRLGRVLGREPYEVEQLGFTLSLLPRLARLRPDLVFVSDMLVSRLLAHWPRRDGTRFKLALSNGGPYPLEAMRHADYVHHPSAPGLAFALDRGESPERHAHVPIGIAIPRELALPSAEERVALRRRLSLPEERPIVLSVAALNSHHKRVDYVIREVASMQPRRPFLLVLGADDPEAEAIRSLAASLLGDADHAIRSVPSSAMPDHYRVADVFTLGSTWEAFGKVLVEALSHGLPCVVHDGHIQRWMLGRHGVFGDLTKVGELARLLTPLCEADRDEGAMRARHQEAYGRFSWDHLTRSYVELFARWSRSP